MTFSPDREPLRDFLASARSDVFNGLAGKLKAGTYYPPKGGVDAEFVTTTPELGWAAAFSTLAEQIESPQLIHGEWCRPEVGISTEFWLTPEGIEVQHSTWDENGDPYATDQKQPIHAEELLGLHSLLLNS